MAGCGSAMVSPSRRMAPALARSRPAIKRRRVVLPQPEPPINPTISDSRTSRVISARAWVPSA
jgi:hypothetical protein